MKKTKTKKKLKKKSHLCVDPIFYQGSAETAVINDGA